MLSCPRPRARAEMPVALGHRRSHGHAHPRPRHWRYLCMWKAAAVSVWWMRHTGSLKRCHGIS